MSRARQLGLRQKVASALSCGSDGTVGRHNGRRPSKRPRRPASQLRQFLGPSFKLPSALALCRCIARQRLPTADRPHHRDRCWQTGNSMAQAVEARGQLMLRGLVVTRYDHIPPT
jgi:hypothetical protein